jgi:hypothetical protein
VARCECPPDPDALPPSCGRGYDVHQSRFLNGTVYATLPLRQGACCARCTADGKKCDGWQYNRTHCLFVTGGALVGQRNMSHPVRSVAKAPPPPPCNHPGFCPHAGPPPRKTHGPRPRRLGGRRVSHSKLGLLWRVCMGAPGARRPKTAVPGPPAEHQTVAGCCDLCYQDVAGGFQVGLGRAVGQHSRTCGQAETERETAHR